MADHVASALFVHTRESEHLIDVFQKNPYGVEMTHVSFDSLMEGPEGVLKGVDHLVVSGSLNVIKEVLGFAMAHGFSVGLIPMNKQKELIKCFALPHKIEAAVDLALKQDVQMMDLVLCNNHIMLFKATMGRLPLMDSPVDIGTINMVVKALKRFVGLELLSIDFTTAGQKKIRTAACGCMLLKHHGETIASRFISQDSSLTDGMISILVSAPRSIVEYVTFLAQARKFTAHREKIPCTIGYIKSARIDIDSERTLDVSIDGEVVTRTPVHCEAIQEAVRINIGDEIREKRKITQVIKERINTSNLPMGKELFRVKTTTLPFFSYASEERFRLLFTALREDAEINPAYLVLMVLSTILATVGLYLDSASVVIGAMLLAPLMDPIVSLSMGLLRQDNNLAHHSFIKIITGIVIALMTAAFITWMYPYHPITPEMEGRLDPSLLDLSVAIFSGIAGAYTKSYKEILHSFAGVAIAVALIPPLAVAGIGIGRLDPQFFIEAFLLFSTNLIGIVLAATFTFRVLGYSSAILGKRSIGLVALFMVLISIPLSLSFKDIVEDWRYEKSWQEERFLVNEKYLIVQQAHVQDLWGKKVVKMEILAREPLTRNDLSKLKKKIQTNFERELIIHVQVIYIP
jgi:uncharacterized hydrophobic protein (TIGR00271 family)